MWGRTDSWEKVEEKEEKDTVLIADAEFQRAVYFVQNVEAALKRQAHVKIQPARKLVYQETKRFKEHQKRKKKQKKRNKIIVLSAGTVLGICAIIAILASMMKPSIDLNKYTTVSIDGYNTVGQAG